MCVGRQEVIDNLRESLDIERERNLELMNRLLNPVVDDIPSDIESVELPTGWKSQQLRIARREREKDLGEFKTGTHGKD